MPWPEPGYTLNCKEDGMPEDFVKVAQTDELAPGEMKAVQLGVEEILLVNVAGEFHAVSEVCTHAYVPLSGGFLEGEEVECPQHGSVFNTKTGEALGPPADQPLTVYSVRIEGTDILIGPPR
jgi:nitrite reductase/ring-hydroxylating ferredoxin subunit